MRFLFGIGLIFAAAVYGLWWWRKSYEPSPLEVHLADLKHRSDIGRIVTRQHYFGRPTFTTVGAGVLTGTRINPNNPAGFGGQNRPGRLDLYPRSAQSV